MQNKDHLNNIRTWIGTKTSLIIHTLVFVGIFLLRFIGVSFQDVLLILTTAVSLEAIYLSIFIQMSVNESNKHIVSVKETVNEVQITVDDVQETVDEVQETVDDVQETIDENEEETITKNK